MVRQVREGPMTDRPIIFSGPMIRKLLGGWKTQTRRILKIDPKDLREDGYGGWDIWTGFMGWRNIHDEFAQPLLKKHKLRFAVGDRLYVRESARLVSLGPGPTRGVAYLSDTEAEVFFFEKPSDAKDMPPIKSVPAIHMPRWASRLTLLVEAVKVERLQDISEADAKAEGAYEAAYPVATILPGGTLTADQIERAINPPIAMSFKAGFRAIWENINGPTAWDANPWVVAVSFRVVKANIDTEEAA